jgi:hypothetical protein
MVRRVALVESSGSSAHDDGALHAMQPCASRRSWWAACRWMCSWWCAAPATEGAGAMSLLSSLVPIPYVQISLERLTGRTACTGPAIPEAPELAIRHDAKPIIVGVGFGAQAAGRSSNRVQVANRFVHPRSLVLDFTVGEQLLKAFVRRLLSRLILGVAPAIGDASSWRPGRRPDAGGNPRIPRNGAWRRCVQGGGRGSAPPAQELLAGRFVPNGPGVVRDDLEHPTAEAGMKQLNSFRFPCFRGAAPGTAQACRTS